MPNLVLLKRLLQAIFIATTSLVAEVRYATADRTIYRECFVSAANEVGVLLLKADRPKGLTTNYDSI